MPGPDGGGPITRDDVEDQGERMRKRKGEGARRGKGREACGDANRSPALTQSRYRRDTGRFLLR
jgi:hypothetical protein